MASRTIADIKSDVGAAIINGGGDLSKIYFNIRENMKKGYRAQSTGIFTIDIWSFREYASRNRGHLFRTKSDGTVPTDKIIAATKLHLQQLAILHEYTDKKAANARANESMVKTLQEYAADNIGVYFSDYKSNYNSAFITNEAEVGKVVVSTGALHLTGDEALQLLELLKTFRPKK